MSIATCINIINVTVLDNPTAFVNPFQFEVTFECLQELPDGEIAVFHMYNKYKITFFFSSDLEWKVIYVGNAEDSAHDQVLEEVMVGPVPVGINRFILTSNAPNPSMIANQDLIGVTVILITCSFMDNKFIQIGYYVNNEYSEPYEPENPPNPVDINKLYRNILSDQPRVTRFAIDWSGGAGPAPASEEVDPQAGEEGTDLAEMEEDDEEEDEEDEEDGEDDNAEVDLADEEEADENEDEELDEDEDNDEDDEDGMSGSERPQHQQHMGGLGMEVFNEDSNSMDVARMLQ